MVLDCCKKVLDSVQYPQYPVPMSDYCDMVNRVKDEGLLGLSRVAQMLDISEREVYRLIAAGLLPKPLKIGRLSKLPLGDVLAYIERLKSARSVTELNVR